MMHSLYISRHNGNSYTTLHNQLLCTWGCQASNTQSQPKRRLPSPDIVHNQCGSGSAVLGLTGHLGWPCSTIGIQHDVHVVPLLAAVMMQQAMRKQCQGAEALL